MAVAFLDIVEKEDRLIREDILNLVFQLLSENCRDPCCFSDVFRGLTMENSLERPSLPIILNVIFLYPGVPTSRWSDAEALVLFVPGSNFRPLAVVVPFENATQVDPEKTTLRRYAVAKFPFRIRNCDAAGEISV